MLTDFEKNVLGATGYDDGQGNIVSDTPAPIIDTPMPTPKKSFFKDTFVGKTLKGAGDVAVGFAKGAGDTLLSVPRNVQKVVVEGTKLSVEKQNNKIRESINAQNEELLKVMKSLPQGDPRREKYKKLIQQNMEQFQELGKSEEEVLAQIDQDASWIPGDKGGIYRDAVNEGMATKNKAQQFGFRAEKIGELIVPAGATAKADKAINAVRVLPGATRGARIVNATARTAAKAGVEAGTAAASTLGQAAYQGRLDTEEGREGVKKEMKQNALFAGGAKMLLAGGGEILNATGLPRKLAAITYKTDKKELAKMLQTYGDDAAQQVDESGETLADWAVRNKLKGNVTQQAKQVIQKLEASEKAVMETAEAAKVRVPVDKGLKTFADDLAEEYAGHGRGEVTKQVQTFLDDMADDGTVSVKEAIKFRRLIDKMRGSTSFRNPRVGDNLKYWADDLRATVNNIDGIGALNKDYAMALKAADALMKKGVSESNKQLVGALEMYTVGLPAVSDSPSLFGAGMVAAKRMVNSPRFQMAGGRFIQNMGNSSKTGIATRRILPEVVRDSMQEDIDGFSQ